MTKGAMPMTQAGMQDALPQGQLKGALRRDSVKKNVAAIHVSGKLTLLQRKLSNVLLLNAYDALVTAPKHSIDARTLCLMIGYNSNDMDTLKDALRSLAETVAEWDMLDAKGRQEWGVSALLSYARLKGGVCEYAYSPALAEKLHDPKVFALINLNIQRRFASGHGLALYENCYRFVRTGSTGWWDLDLFRRLMGVEDSDYYRNFKHLNAKVIKPAVAEVNKNSNITITPEFARKGRAIAEIRFLIQENPQLAMLGMDDGAGTRSGAVYARLRALGVSDRLARQWISEHGEDYVRDKLDYVAGQGGVKSPLRYLSAAIERDFSAAAAPPPAAPRPHPVAGPAPVPADPEQAARQRQAAARRRDMEVVAALVAARNPTQRDADRKLFTERLDNDLDRAHFAREGWQSALNARAIIAFWREMSPAAFDPEAVE
ncbi:replication initiation protein [Paracoccus jiaweipingae]|uniref:replication initiation protein n=1 Tax=unclassified Paracoccus (in: a-proteobacteria) TaxID=2688777 RepID=UPI0037A8CADD